MLNPPSEMYRAASTVSPVKTPPYESTSAPIPPPMKLPASTIVQWRRCGDTRKPFQGQRDRRERVLGVQLVAADDDVDEPERIEEHAQDRMGIGRGRQRCVQHEGDRDRQPRREPAEEEFAAPGGHLLVRGSDDPLEHLVGREAVPNRFADRRRTAAGALDDFAHRIVVGACRVGHCAMALGPR